MHRTGTPWALAPEEGLAAYRVCQEALTSVLKYSGRGAIVTVALSWTATAFELEVTDGGRGAGSGADAARGGLAAMHDQALLVGAALDVESRADGSFRVRLQIVDNVRHARH